MRKVYGKKYDGLLRRFLTGAIPIVLLILFPFIVFLEFLGLF
jgi:hypothetical protein